MMSYSYCRLHQQTGGAAAPHQRLQQEQQLLQQLTEHLTEQLRKQVMKGQQGGHGDLAGHARQTLQVHHVAVVYAMPCMALASRHHAPAVKRF